MGGSEGYLSPLKNFKGDENGKFPYPYIGRRSVFLMSNLNRLSNDDTRNSLALACTDLVLSVTAYDI